MDTVKPVSENGTESAKQFGTFGGVFTPSILTILGVIMFMRAGFVVGNAGVRNALIILAIAKSITLLTGFSISAIATNTAVKGGGAYFLISRTLGPEFGGTIGLTLYCAQALSVPFYILGFSEAFAKTLSVFFPSILNAVPHINFVTLGLLFFVAYAGADWAIKAQYGIMVILGLSIATFLGGAAFQFEKATLVENWNAVAGGRYGFWVVFAIYFPAVTGIMAGVNMSGNLKNPSRSLPLGTFAAIIVGMLVYGAQIVLCGGSTSRDALIATPYQSLMKNALFGMGFMVALGVFAATLSSALGSFLGAPRILQALAQDDIIRPVRFFSGMSKSGEPRRALWLTLIISAGVLYYAGSGEGEQSLNMIAALVTMLFLFTYGITNLSAFVESFGGNPSFRPRFKLFHWSLALAGAVGCVFTAFLINAGATLGAVAFILLIFMYVRKFVLETSFGDARRGFVYSRIRDNLLKLARLPAHPKNWRPTTLVLTGNPDSRLALVKYAIWMGSGRGIVILAAFIIGELHEKRDEHKRKTQELSDFTVQNHLQAFTQVIVAPDFDLGLNQLLQAGNVGPLKANVVVFGFPTDPGRARNFVRHLDTAQLCGMSQVVIFDAGLPVFGRRTKKVIDIWWRGKSNGSLMIILAYLISLNGEWTNTVIRILRLVKNEQERQPAFDEMKEFIDAARLAARLNVIVADKPFRDILHAYSAESTVLFIGFKAPPETDAISFQQYMAGLLKGLPTTILVHSTGEADLAQ